jgi:hypothetical protein
MHSHLYARDGELRVDVCVCVCVCGERESYIYLMSTTKGHILRVGEANGTKLLMKIRSLNLFLSLWI